MDVFVSFCCENALLGPDDRVIVGVSGGVDSMVLVELLRRSKVGGEVAVAHCNFSLRGAESDQDQRIVEQYAQRHGLKMHCAKFETEALAKERGESIQMTARELRYIFFEDLCREHGYTKIAIAHHLDDSSETFLINTIRGTGLRGLCGIPIKRDKIVRPLMFATRAQILQWAQDQAVQYRNDSTNESTKYLRNFLRHKVLPLMQECIAEQDINHRIAANQQHLAQAMEFVDRCMDRVRRECVDTATNTIDIEKIRRWGEIEFVLYELLCPLGFKGATVREMAQSIESRGQGKQFFGPRHVALIDRGKIVVEPIKEQDQTQEKIQITYPKELSISQIKAMSKETAYLSSERLSLPLVLRKWQKGDWFCPLGMNGQRKLLSDFLIDLKINIRQKERQTVVLEHSTGNIVWVTGLRPDHRYRVTDPQKVIAITISKTQTSKDLNE